MPTNPESKKEKAAPSKSKSTPAKSTSEKRPASKELSKPEGPHKGPTTPKK